MMFPSKPYPTTYEWSAICSMISPLGANQSDIQLKYFSSNKQLLKFKVMVYNKKAVSPCSVYRIIFVKIDKLHNTAFEHNSFWHFIKNIPLKYRSKVKVKL